MNHIEQATKLFTEFLRDDRLCVLAFKGPWGVGKSFFIRDYLKQDRPEIPALVSYVSLFGLRTIQEVRQTITDCMVYNKDKIPKSVLNALSSSKRLRLNFGFFSYEVPDLNTALFWRIAKRNTVLIIFDDLERKNEELKMDQILGLASSVSENSKAKFVIIFDENNLGNNSKIVSQYREKVIDVEFAYHPNTRELTSKFLQDNSVLETVINCLDISGGPNIRIIHHINRTISFFRELLMSRNYALDESSVLSIASTTWLFYVSPLPLTAESFVSATMSWYRGADHADGLSEENKRLAELVKQASLRHGDLDSLVINYLRDGYIDQDTLKAFLSNANKQAEEAEFNKKLVAAYKPFVTNFRANVEECTAPVESVLIDYAAKIGLEVMIDTCRFLEAFGRPTEYVWRKHVEARAPQLSVQTLRSYLSVLKDSDSIAIINQHLDSNQSNFNAPDTIRKIVDHNGWHPNDIKRLNDLSDEYYLNWFRNEDQKLLKMLRSFLHICLLGEAGGEEIKLREKLIRVMRQLSDENPATKVRLTRYFELPPDQTEE